MEICKLQKIPKEGKGGHYLIIPVPFIKDLNWAKGDHIKMEIKGNKLVMEKV